jgi:hypothetical protein
MPRVFSECRGIPKEDCPEKPICIYVNGVKYRYCRLSGRYVLDKETGKAVLRQTKKNRAQLIQKMAEEMKPAKESSYANKTRKIREAKERVHRFMRNTTFKRRARYLLNQCLDSGLCLAFGTEAKRIKSLFRNFQGLSFIRPPIKRIGTPSANGFVHEIHYKRQGYDAYTVLKSSARSDGDNLYYEYLIGKAINEVVYILPQFVETYGIYSYRNKKAWHHAKSTNMITTNSLFEGLQNLEEAFPNDNDKIKTSCENSKNIAVMIQHLKDVKTLGDSLKDIVFLNEELVYILFQVYAALSVMDNTFTHYDLHLGNVLLYQPVKNSYIHYHYHLTDGKTVSFYSSYMAKIIDYGRSYLSGSSKNIFKKVCKVCGPECGYFSGYHWLSNNKTNPLEHYIASSHNNISHDLRLLNSINKSMPKGIPISLEKLIKKVVYEGDYGTPEKRASGLPKHIHNVNDAFIELRKYVEDEDTQFLNDDTFLGKPNKLGDLHIYMGEMKPMRFVKA